MSTEVNKQTVRQFYQAVDHGNLNAVEALFAPNWVNVDPALPPMRGLEGARMLTAMFTAAFPDFTSTIEEIVAEGDRVAVRATHSGTHRGPFMGISGTGRRATVTATGIFKLEGGKLLENRVVFDAFGLLQQLGVMPQNA